MLPHNISQKPSIFSGIKGDYRGGVAE